MVTSDGLRPSANGFFTLDQFGLGVGNLLRRHILLPIEGA